MIISRTPFRVSLFGGGSDYPKWYHQHGGAVFGFAINKYCYISIRQLPPFFEYRHRIVYSKVENVSEFDEIQHPAVRAVLQDRGVDVFLIEGFFRAVPDMSGTRFDAERQPPDSGPPELVQHILFDRIDPGVSPDVEV